MVLEMVVYEPRCDIHTTPERDIATMFKNDIVEFSPQHIRVVHLKQDAVLGNHWRDYSELYAVVGKALFVLEDIDTKEKKEYCLETGDRLLVPPRVALRVSAPASTVIIACSSDVDRERKTHKYIVS